MSTAHKTSKEIKEHTETPENLQTKINKLSQLITAHQHVVFFTGAGISTSCGIPDFRGPEGVWTLKAQNRKRTGKSVSTCKAIPSPSHMAIVELINQGKSHYVISQNVDGLHRKSGILPSQLSELHGNTNIETCEKCRKEYVRDFHVRNNPEVHKHFTGRHCENPRCGGKLHDSIINFGEGLPENAFKLAQRHSKKCDLMIVLGSSLRVTPAADLSEYVGEHPDKKLVIVNMQVTPQDHLSRLRIFHRCDEVMEGVMQQLSLQIPKFMLLRKFVISHFFSGKQKDLVKIIVTAIDGEYSPMTLFKDVTISLNKDVSLHLVTPPFLCNFDFKKMNITPSMSHRIPIRFCFSFWGHYFEPQYVFEHYLSDMIEDHTEYALNYSPHTRTWESNILKIDESKFKNILYQEPHQ